VIHIASLRRRVYNNVIQLVKKYRHKEYNKSIEEFFLLLLFKQGRYDVVIVRAAHTLFDSCWSAGDVTDKDKNQNSKHPSLIQGTEVGLGERIRRKK
jgi:hypothetical protein